MKHILTALILTSIIGCTNHSFDSGVHYRWDDKSSKEKVYSSPEFSWETQLEELALSNAEPDAISAFYSEQYWFIATLGIGIGFPGLTGTNSVQSEEYINLRETYGYRVVTGTSDHIGSDIQKDVCTAAHHYATAYNTKMLELIKANEMHNQNMEPIPTTPVE